ncbi:MAG: ABC transporter permease [Trueperaceae bacterium]|nr:ABC transporter permease [Trueperaceae bacterium]
MTSLTLPVTDLRRRPLRTTLTGLGIAVAVSSFLTLVSLAQGLERGWIASLESRGVHLLALSRDTVEVMASSLPEELAGRIEAVEGVRHASGELANLVRLDAGGTETVHATVRGWPPGSFKWDELALREGRPPGPSDEDGAVVGAALARLGGLRVGATLQVRGRALRVTGVAEGGGVWNERTLFLPLATMQSLFDRPGQVTEFALQVDRPHDHTFVQELRATLEEAFPRLTFLPAEQVVRENDVVTTFRAFSWAVSAVAMAMALVVVANTLLMSVTERVREIAILVALGWSQQRVLADRAAAGVPAHRRGGGGGRGVGGTVVAGRVAAPDAGRPGGPGLEARPGRRDARRRVAGGRARQPRSRMAGRACRPGGGSAPWLNGLGACSRRRSPSSPTSAWACSSCSPP